MRMPGYLHPLSGEEEDERRSILTRAEELAHHAHTRGVRLMVDAEQTYFQLAIRNIAVNILMPKYNQHAPVIYNTQQCYLKVSSNSTQPGITSNVICSCVLLLVLLTSYILWCRAPRFRTIVGTVFDFIVLSLVAWLECG